MIIKMLNKIKQFFLTPSFSLVMFDAAIAILGIIGWHLTHHAAFIACEVYFLLVMAIDTYMAWNYKKGNKEND